MCIMKVQITSHDAWRALRREVMLLARIAA